jgi:hypothetical protein
LARNGFARQYQFLSPSAMQSVLPWSASSIPLAQSRTAKKVLMLFLRTG